MTGHFTEAAAQVAHHAGSAGHGEGGLSMLPHVGMLLITGAAFLGGFGVLGRERRVEEGTTSVPHAALRWPMIGLLFLASMAHVPVIPDHLSEAPYMGALFVVFSATAFGLAALLALRPTDQLYDAGGVLCLAAIVAYALTRSVALPQLGHDVGHWTDPLGIAAILAETGAAVVALMARREQLGAPQLR